MPHSQKVAGSIPGPQKSSLRGHWTLSVSAWLFYGFLPQPKAMLIRASWQLQIAQVRADGCLSLRVGPGCDGLGGGLVSHGHDGVQQTRDTKCRGRGKGKQMGGWNHT